VDEDDWLASARTLAERFAARAAKHDREGSFPFENFHDLREAGFLRLTVPPEHGGSGAGLTTFLRVQEELARGDGSTALGYMMHARLFGQQRDAALYSEAWFNEFCRGAVEDGSLCNTIATEEGLGSPAGGGLPDTTALEDGGEWVLNGRKTFATLSPVLRHFIVLARVDGPPGVAPELASFVVYPDDAGARVEETWDALGMRATGSHDFVMEGCRIPAGRLATRRGAAGSDMRNAAGITWFALGVAATTIGVATAARDYAVAFARERTPNSQRTIKEFAGVRTRVARIELLLQRSRALVYDAARAYETGQGRGLSAVNRVAVAKIDAINSCIEAVDLAMRVVGGVSLQKSRPIERYYRDVRSGLHNPPLEDRALEMLARAALDETGESRP
jgi:alkylation response protein AidB-like acyl-CoA dehydrogenase